MPASPKRPRPWTMPDSAYDYDPEENPAYFAIRQYTILFHSQLKSRTELNKREDDGLTLDHFDRAFRQLLRTMNRNNRKRIDWVWDIFGELVLIIGGIIIAPIINELGVWLQADPSQRGVFTPESISVLLSGIGILLIVIKIILNNR